MDRRRAIRICRDGEAQVKFLTLTQPVGTLMAIGAKRIETRGFRTSYRGDVAIHAAQELGGLPALMKMRGLQSTGKKQTDFLRLCLSQPFNSVLTEHMRSLEVQTINSYLDELPFGGIVCVVDLVMCLSTNGHSMQFASMDIEIKDGVVVKDERVEVSYEMPSPDSNEYAFGNYSPDRWMWFTENLRRLRAPVPCRGVQGLRDLPADIEALVRKQI